MRTPACGGERIKAAIQRDACVCASVCFPDSELSCSLLTLLCCPVRQIRLLISAPVFTGETWLDSAPLSNKKKQWPLRVLILASGSHCKSKSPTLLLLQIQKLKWQVTRYESSMYHVYVHWYKCQCDAERNMAPFHTHSPFSNTIDHQWNCNLDTLISKANINLLNRLRCWGAECKTTRMKQQKVWNWKGSWLSVYVWILGLVIWHRNHPWAPDGLRGKFFFGILFIQLCGLGTASQITLCT